MMLFHELFREVLQRQIGSHSLRGSLSSETSYPKVQSWNPFDEVAMCSM